MRHPEFQYLDILTKLINSPVRETRNDTETRSFFGASMELDMADGFPLLTTKRVPFKSVALELDWFLSGNTNAKWLEDRGVTIWQEWGDPATREMGPIYGAQLRNQAGVIHDSFDKWGENTIRTDQVDEVLYSLKRDPYSRRHVMTLWSAAQIDDMALPPCHGIAIQFYVENDGRLSLFMHQRSADAFLGLPFNIASYSLMLHYFAHCLDRIPGRFLWSGGDVHLYGNHFEQAIEQLSRDPRDLPGVIIRTERGDALPSYDDGEVLLVDYNPHPAIKADVSA